MLALDTKMWRAMGGESFLSLGVQELQPRVDAALGKQ